MKKTIAAIAVALALGAGLYVWHAESDGDAATALFAAGSPPPAQAPPADSFKDTSMLRAPAGAKVAIYEFDDLECPACAHALPLVHAAVERYGIPLLHHDFPLTEIHVWSFDAAVTARYLQDDVSPRVADNFRRDIFAHQSEILSKDDLDRFTRVWFQQNGQKLPFVMDASGACRNEVKADRALGDRIGIHSTPCIFVVTEHGFTRVNDPDTLPQTIETAMAESKS